MRSMTWIPLRASGAASVLSVGTAISSLERDFGYYSKTRKRLRRPAAIDRLACHGFRCAGRLLCMLGIPLRGQATTTINKWSEALANKRVGLFVTCLVDLMRPRIGFAALKLLEPGGCEVIVPDTQT